jgi:putative oxidoreductase
VNAIVYHAARIVLGAMFLVFGLNGVLHFIPNPPVIPAAALTFMRVMFQTHFAAFVFGVQALCGVLLLIARFVPLATIALAAVIANIFAFHITMWPASIVPLPLIALILWFVVAWGMREHLLPVLSADAAPSLSPAARRREALGR